MDPDRWQTIERLYHAAREHDPDARARFLDASCGNDLDLRREVESLIALDSDAAEFLKDPALAVAARTLARRQLRSFPFRLGAYEVIAPLGAGGMGCVFRARDLRLHRQVALKLLPEHLAANATARERLRREALAAAALDHPFICKIFDIVEQDGIVVIAMEIVEGETLAERLRRGSTERGEALRIGSELAEALEAAHARGVVHRDLKPGNVMLTTGGRVKVMDFGIAKRFTVDDHGPIEPTATDLSVGSGPVGTPAYMSPEQIAGEMVDVRTDLFSFGILLCELLTGVHPFRRTTAQATTAAIAYEQPQLPEAALADPLLGILRRLLAKRPDARYPTISAVRDDLQRCLSTPTGSAPTSPSSSSRARRSPLVGREHERRELLKRLADASAGSGAVVLISGEPGIGKTRLTQDVVVAAEQQNCLAVVGHCREAEGAPPYAPFIDIFERLAETLPPDQLRQLLGDSAPEIARLMPAVARRFQDVRPTAELPPQHQRRVFFSAFRDFARRLGQLAPLVFVLEDLQWADEPTLLLFDYLAEEIRSLPLLLVGTHRELEPDLTRPFARTLEGLVRGRLAQRMTLKRLPLESVEALLSAMSGQPPPERLTRAIHQHTEGNPFFVEEVFQHLSEEGKLFTPAGGWQSNLRVSDVQVPEGVRLVIRRRLERLTPATVRTLTTAAVIGLTFGVTLLEAVCADGHESVSDSIEEAEAARLVAAEDGEREPRYRFVHALIRQTMVEAVSLPRRQRLHARIAAAMEELHGARVEKQAPALAHHLLQAGSAADPQKTRTFVALAAEQARAAAAYEDALTYFDAALALTEEESSADAADLHERRADVLRRLGHFDLAAAAYDRAINLYDTIGDVVKLAATTFPLILIHAWNADARKHLAATTRALDRLRDTSPVLRARVLFLHALGLTTSGDAEGGLVALEEAKRLRSEVEDPALNVIGGVLEAHVRYQAMQIPRVLEATHEAKRLCEAAGDLWGCVDMDWHQVMAAVYLSRPGDARRMAEVARPLAERVGHYNVTWFYRLLGASLELADGHLAAAESKANEALVLGEEYRIPWNFSSELTLAQVAFYQGRIDTAVSHYRRAIELEPPSYWSGMSRAALFAALAEHGDSTALSVLHEVPIRLPVPQHANSFGSWVSLTFVVEGLASTGRYAEVAALQSSSEALVDTGVHCFRDMRLYRTVAGIASASAGDWSRADEHFAAAIRQAEAGPLRIANAHARMWYGKMLKHRGADYRQQSQVLLNEAVVMFEALEMPGFASRTRRILTTD